MKFTSPHNPQITINDLNKCSTCACNNICDHNKFGYENCNNYIPGWISTRIALPENDTYVLRLKPNAFPCSEVVEVVYFNSERKNNDWHQLKTDCFWMPIPDFKLIL